MSNLNRALPASSAPAPTYKDDELLALIDAELERRRLSETRKFAQWKDDPVGFVENALLGFLWSKQREVALSVRDHRVTMVPSCHDVGKTALAARIAAWWIAPYEPGEAFVVSLAPTAHQVKALLWRELNRVHQVGGLPGRMNMTEWYIGNELVAFGRSPADNDPTAVQGIHAARVLLIVDEACGVAKAIIDAASSLVANEDSRTLMIGNPDDPSTEFAELSKPGAGTNVISISAFDSPNFTGEVVPDWLRPLLVSKTWVEERKRRWGVGSPLYTSKVLGKFPEQSTDGLVSISDLNAAKARGADLERMPGDGGGDLGVDVARFGDDSSVIYHRRGDFYERLKSSQKRDLMHLCGLVVDAVRETKARRVKIDDAGMGGGVTDRLREIQSDPSQAGHAVLQNVEIIPINVGESPRADQSDERFKNLRAEINWQTRERFTSGKITLLEKEPGELDDLLSEAAQIKYKLTSGGEIQIEAKADMKKRLAGSSPDDWDALVLAGAEPQFPGAGMLEYYRQLHVDAENQRKGAPARPGAAEASGTPPPFPYGKPAAEEGGKTALRAPAGVSTAYGMLGNRYDVGGDRMVYVLADDVAPLCSAGFEKV